MRIFYVFLMIGFLFGGTAMANPASWQYEWPKTNFDKTSIDFAEIKSGGPPKDGIPPIDDPVFVSVPETLELSETEPVIGLTINGDMRAYPIRILMWHEIVNDTVGGVPVSVTFCPLCNAAIVFNREVETPSGIQVLDFGTTGKLRRSDLVMWDRQTESWWQQFTGEAIVGELTGTNLQVLPSRLESWGEFRARATEKALVLFPNNVRMRRYGANPYQGYDSLAQPFLYDGETPAGIEPLERVVSLAPKTEAWTLAYIQQNAPLVASDGTEISWSPGQNSALDTALISKGKDVGTVTAIRDGKDVPYFVDFAFAFHAFRPEIKITTLP